MLGGRFGTRPADTNVGAVAKTTETRVRAGEVSVCSCGGRIKSASPTGERGASLLPCGQHEQTHAKARKEMLERFGRGPEVLSEALRKCPKQMWLYRTGDRSWTIHEIILHLADREAEGYLRCRQFIAEPGTGAQTLDAPKWATTLGYFHQSTRDALALIRRLRRMTYQILQYIPDPVWQHTVRDSQKGIITLDEWFELQTRHIPHHLEQIRQNYFEWERQLSKPSPGRV
jgi:DinB superfamily